VGRVRDWDFTWACRTSASKRRREENADDIYGGVGGNVEASRWETFVPYVKFALML